jgi:hypothetical protein
MTAESFQPACTLLHSSSISRSRKITILSVVNKNKGVTMSICLAIHLDESPIKAWSCDETIRPPPLVTLAMEPMERGQHLEFRESNDACEQTI